MIKKYDGAWMTDIDDTFIKSGEMPSDAKISELVEFLKVLIKHNIAWIPMSGVAIVKLGPRIIYRLPKDILTHVMYYGGDGSHRYFYNDVSSEWEDDQGFKRLFSDAQIIAVIGVKEFRIALANLYNTKDVNDSRINERLSAAQEVLKSHNIDTENGILDEMKAVLKKEGFKPEESETYYRGGSVSWMMLGDISADPYKDPKAIKVRKDLIELAKKRLSEHKWLKQIGDTGINIPFPGARGIKFVLIGNDKERATRHLMKNFKIDSKKILFAGNELIEGGNDNMIRNIKGITLLSVGSHEDPGKFIVYGNFSINGKSYHEDEANKVWMKWVVDNLNKGKKWVDILKTMRKYKAEELLKDYV